MSQKKNKQAKQKKDNQATQKKKKSFPWGMVLVAVLVVIAAGFYLSQRQGLKPHGSGPPKIAVDQPKIEYGYVRFGTNKSFDLEVTNVGGSPLRFTEAPYIKVLAGC